MRGRLAICDRIPPCMPATTSSNIRPLRQSAGAAIVEFAEGTAPLTLKPGDVVRLAKGAETVWTVTETLRKVYLV